MAGGPGAAPGLPGSAGTLTPSQLLWDGIAAARTLYAPPEEGTGSDTAREVEVGDVRAVVASNKTQLADQAMYRYVGIEPTEQKILVNKSSVHFRADFEPIAEKLLICAAPGAMPADTADLPWTRLRPGIRIKPNGPAFQPTIKSRLTG